MSDGMQYCGEIDWWMEANHSTWTQCRGVMTDAAEGNRIIHQCAASYDHTGDHVCAMGHRWRQAKPRRRWRDLIRRRQR